MAHRAQKIIMERHFVEIRIDKNYVAIETDGNMPCLLADKIKAVVKDFYKENK